MKYLVHLKPPQEIVDRIDQIRLFNQESVRKISTNVDHLTLMTLYSKARGTDNEEEIVNELEHIVQEPFFISGFLKPTQKNIHYQRNKRLILTLDSEERWKLKNLHQQIIKKLKKYINWKEVSKLAPQFHDTPREEVYREFGSPYYAEFFNSHITVGEVTDGKSLSSKEVEPIMIANPFWHVGEMWLHKKRAGGWESVRRFILSATKSRNF